ncbi:hypothetical protein Micbo1qcDRAFT_156216 [Microdochium bolleyi]|uniref:Uncharacterized protein n=1 Tax=Microdochium bolleyi TaxID=196109 RepID=A0A136JJP0_9PEZI|nr:hypothetical protein Micbo1qcDRAFT_156216 [Microdochium bolleyi]
MKDGHRCESGIMISALSQHLVSNLLMLEPCMEVLERSMDHFHNIAWSLRLLQDLCILVTSIYLLGWSIGAQEHAENVSCCVGSRTSGAS